MPEYLRVNSRGVTFREYWNITRSVTVIIPWVAKLLNIPMNFGSGIPRVEAVRDLEIPESEFSAAAREKLQPWLDQCLTLGCHSPQFFCLKSLGGDMETSFISLLHTSNEYSVRLMHTVATAANTAKVNTLVVLLSELNDGTYMITSDQRAKFQDTPGVTVNRLIKGSPDQLVELHRRRLGELKVQNHPTTISSIESQYAVWDRYEKLSNDYGLKRGLYVLLTPEEQDAAVKRLDVLKELKAAGVENADVLAQLNQLQEKKRGWGSAIIILVVSALLFVGAGARQWTWELTLLLVPILLIHEMGHYVAMRVFNYRNLRMFFIPFFGAAVSGRHYNVPGWKKVVVSMMGPLPGIILGALIGSMGVVLQQPWMIKVALLTVILNGFNLLPVLPLDGGWIFHTLIFSRHYLLDAAFRLLAVIALVVGGTFSQDKILMYLSIPMAMGIPMAYRMARVVTKLRRSGVPPASADDQTIPTETAQAIIAELKQVLPKIHTTKMVAERTLQVFETLNARPPGWPATVGLLFVHLASVAVSLVFVVVLIFGRDGFSTRIFPTAMPELKHKLACDSISAWRGNLASEINTNAQNTLIATFGGNSAAGNAFQRLTNELPSNAALKAFGDTLLLSLPADDDAARQKWLAELKQQAKDVFVENASFPGIFSVSFLAPSEQVAKEIEAELQEYFNTLPALSLRPPWSPVDSVSPAQLAEYRVARQTYLKLINSNERTPDDAEMRKLSKKMMDARKQGDVAEVESLQKELQQLYETAERKHIDRVRTATLGPVDTNIIELFAAQKSVQVKTNFDALQKQTREMAQHMGQAAPEEACYLARYGIVIRKDVNLNLSWFNFERVSEGVPALIVWLCDNGCTDFKYDFQSRLSGSDED